MKFLFVGSNICRQLLSDSQLPTTPLLLTNDKYCNSRSGLAPYSIMTMPDTQKGMLVAFLAGIMSACFAFGIAAGEDIVKASSEAGTAPLFVNSLLFGVIMLGGLMVNFFYCGYMLIKKEYFKHNTFWSSYAAGNVMLCVLAGFTWYSQFLFYGMGSTQMGKYDFASWSLHMSFIIILSNAWGIKLKEWNGVSKKIYCILISGLVVLILLTVIIGTAQLIAA